MVRTSVCVKRRLCPVSQKVNFELGKEKEIYERVRMDADKSQTVTRSSRMDAIREQRDAERNARNTTTTTKNNNNNNNNNYYLSRQNRPSRSFRAFQRFLNDISQAILHVWGERFGDVVRNDNPKRLRDRLNRLSGEVREVFFSRR